MSAAGIPEGLREAALHGSYCPKMCNFACPVLAATGREATAPWALHRAVTAVADGEGGSAEEVYRSLHGCTGCHACREACLYDLDVPAEVRAARRAVVATGMPPAVAVVVEAVRAGRSPYAGSAGTVGPAGRPEEDSAELGADAGCSGGAGEVVALVPGCADGAAEVAAAERLLSAAGSTVRTIRPSGCCGALLDDLGAGDAGEEARAALDGRIPAAAVRLVGTDPHCLGVLSELAGGRPVRHLGEELAIAVEEDRLDLESEEGGREVTVHDPCVLARDHGVVAGPRRVLAAAGHTVVEPEGTGRGTVCSGAGMGLDLLDGDAASAVAARRAASLPHVPTVTTCARARRRLAGAGVEALDLAGVVVARATGGRR